MFHVSIQHTNEEILMKPTPSRYLSSFNLHLKPNKILVISRTPIYFPELSSFHIKRTKIPANMDVATLKRGFTTRAYQIRNRANSSHGASQTFPILTRHSGPGVGSSRQNNQTYTPVILAIDEDFDGLRKDLAYMFNIEDSENCVLKVGWAALDQQPRETLIRISRITEENLDAMLILLKEKGSKDILYVEDSTRPPGPISFELQH